MVLISQRSIVNWMVVLMLTGMATACAASRAAPPAQVLAAPATTVERAALYMAEGTRYFLAREWSQASQAFQQAVIAQPELAEAQYNLAVSLDHEGKPPRRRSITFWLRASRRETKSFGTPRRSSMWLKTNPF